MRSLQAVAGLVTICAVGSYLWGHHVLAGLLGWIVFPLVILADFILEKRKSSGR
jgi:hypothetical protein